MDLSAVEKATDGSAQIVCLNPFTVQDVLDDVLRVGKALGTEQHAQAEVDKLSQRITAATSLATECSAGHAEPLKVHSLLHAGCYTPAC